MKGLKAIVVVVGLMLCFPVASYAGIVNSGAYEPTIYPDDEVTVWGDYYPDDLGDIIVGFVDDDQGNDYADVLFVNSTSNVQDMKSWYRTLNADNDTDTVEVVATLQLHDYTGDYGMGGCAIWVGNGTKEEAIIINPDGIRTYFADGEYSDINFDPTEKYHEYRIVLNKNNIEVYLDGEGTPVISEASETHAGAENYIMFGDGSRGAGSIVTWAKITYKIYYIQ